LFSLVKNSREESKTKMVETGDIYNRHDPKKKSVKFVINKTTKRGLMPQLLHLFKRKVSEMWVALCAFQNFV
jgi:hypothetical protein